MIDEWKIEDFSEDQIEWLLMFARHVCLATKNVQMNPESKFEQFSLYATCLMMAGKMSELLPDDRRIDNFIRLPDFDKLTNVKSGS